MDMTVEVMDPDFDPLDLESDVDQVNQADSSEDDILSQYNEVDLSELMLLLADHQDTTALIQEDAAQYYDESLRMMEDFHNDLLMIFLILLLTFARACLSSARSLLEKSGKAVK